MPEKNWGPESIDLLEKIIVLIECSRPSVDAAFLSSWQENIEIETDAGGTVHPAKWQLKALLKEAGVEIKEEKDGKED